MRTAGVREARQDLTSLLDDVRKGREVIITERGRPVARLVPIRAADAFPRFEPARPGGAPCQSPALGSRAAGPRGTRMTGDSAAWVGPVYLDASALVKLLVSEPESDALNQALQRVNGVIISDLAITETASAAPDDAP